MLQSLATNSTSFIGVGFGTAALGNRCHEVVLMALEAGFTKFDTAEENQWWYNQKQVGTALQEHFSTQFTATTDDECVMVDSQDGEPVCQNEAQQSNSDCSRLQISTKIPPWELTSAENIRGRAANSRRELIGFCSDDHMMDVYYIHAPACWKGWHTRCEDPPPLLDLRSSWLSMEAVVGIDHSSKRIGLSNVRPDELLDIIAFVREREGLHSNDGKAPPRIPDVVQSYADPIRPAEPLRKICDEHGIEFVSYSTLGTQHRGGNQNPVLGSPLVQALAAKHGRSTAEVVLSWARQHNMSVIPRSSKRVHIQELARLLNAPNGFLDSDDMAHMETLKNIA